MFNTFFFGYLPFKWKRLARVLSIFLTIAAPMVAAATTNYYQEDRFFLTLVIVIILIPVVSYTLKPFIVKD
tara:strand:- start:1643 stop:1855 length:213 start_codon:yes stop_codon:yes gene_type:complete